MIHLPDILMFVYFILQGCLPLVLMFDMKEDVEIDQGRLSWLSLHLATHEIKSTQGLTEICPSTLEINIIQHKTHSNQLTQKSEDFSNCPRQLFRIAGSYIDDKLCSLSKARSKTPNISTVTLKPDTKIIPE